MREELAKAEGMRGTFTAKFSRFGSKKAFKGPPLTTVLLLEVKDASGKVTCDHIWFTAGKQFKNLMLKPGEEIQFDARITVYWKGYQGRESWDAAPRQKDYRLSFPTNVHKVTPREIAELPLFANVKP